MLQAANYKTSALRKEQPRAPWSTPPFNALGGARCRRVIWPILHTSARCAPCTYYRLMQELAGAARAPRNTERRSSLAPFIGQAVAGRAKAKRALFDATGSPRSLLCSPLRTVVGRWWSQMGGPASRRDAVLSSDVGCSGALRSSRPPLYS